MSTSTREEVVIVKLRGPALLVEDSQRRHGRVGGLRDPALKLQSGDLSSQSRMVRQMDKGNGEQTSREHGQL